MKLLVALVGVLIAAFALVTPVYAEEPDALVVVLDVPGGGTETLVRAIDEIDGVAVQGQKWFLGEISSRGISPKRILRRPKDLKWVINGAGISYIVYLAKSESDEALYDVGFIGESGEDVQKFTVDVTESGLSDTGAKVIVDELKKLVKKPEKPVVATKPVDVVEEPVEDLDPNEKRRLAMEEKERLKERLTKDWLVATLAGRVYSRSLAVTSANGTQMSYSSAPFPGVELKVDGFPGAFADPDYADVGFVLRVGAGAGKVESITSDSMLMIDGEVGPSFRLVSPIGQEGGTTAVRAQAKLTLRYTSFMVDSPVLPETSMIAPTLGASVAYPVFAPGFAVTGYFDVVPFGIWGTNKEGFGETAQTFAFSSGLGMIYAINKMLGVVAGFDFRLERTNFTGRGEFGFEDASGFEFLQSAHLGALLTL